MKLFARSIAIFVAAMSLLPLHNARGQASLTKLSDTFEELVERVGPSVVQIIASGYGYVDQRTTSGLLARQRGVGSGVILDATGYIITNAHVVTGARRVQVVLPLEDRKEQRFKSALLPAGRRVGAQIIGIDRETDLALLKVQAEGLPHLELSDSDALRQGQIVMAFGSPFGLDNSVSMGVVSALSRQLRPEDPMVYIQTDATINPGNSGGPLLDTDGRVVGINTFIVSQSGGSEGVGFAAPSNIVGNVYKQLRSSGRVRRGHIGIHAQTITPTIAKALDLPRDWGVLIGDVYPGGPAEAAGMRVGDIITSLNAKTMENGRQFDVNLYRYAPGDQVTIELLRGTSTETVRVGVMERQDDPGRFLDMVNPERNLIPKLGILAIDVDRDIMPMLPPLRIEEGVLVAARSADAPFYNDALEPGDVIHTLNLTVISDLKSLREEVRKLRTGDAVVCQVERQGRLQFIAFEIDL